jgi:glycosyltransferase involved in cell wall biosynthesis
VAAVIAAYNRAELVGRAVRSALAQYPCPPAEVIVVDDGSTDATAEVAAAAGARVIRHETNRGAATARNTAVAATEQPWIAPLDSDDEWLPQHLRTLFPLREGHVLVSGASLTVSSTSSAPGYGGTLAPAGRVLTSPAPLVFPENFVSASGVLFSADAFRVAGGYDASLRHAEDFDLWIRLLSRGTGVCVPVPVTLYRRHEGQKSRTGEASRDDPLAIVASYRHEPWCTSELVEQRRAVNAWDELRESLASGQQGRALRLLSWIARAPHRRRAVVQTLRRRRALRLRGARLGAGVSALRTSPQND